MWKKLRSFEQRMVHVPSSERLSLGAACLTIFGMTEALLADVWGQPKTTGGRWADERRYLSRFTPEDEPVSSRNRGAAILRLVMPALVRHLPELAKRRERASSGQWQATGPVPQRVVAWFPMEVT